MRDRVAGGLAAAVLHRSDLLELRQRVAETDRQRGKCRTQCPRRALLDLERETVSPSKADAQSPSAPPLAIVPGSACIVSVSVRQPSSPTMTGCSRIGSHPRAPPVRVTDRRPPEARAVSVQRNRRSRRRRRRCPSDRGRREAPSSRQSAHLRCDLRLERVLGGAVALPRPAVGAARTASMPTCLPEQLS